MAKNTNLIKLGDAIQQFLKLLKRYADKKDEKGYYAKVFQALRIEVKEELHQVKELLMQCSKLMKEKGRLVVISYNSLEDKIVKVIEDNLRDGQLDVQYKIKFYGKTNRYSDPMGK